VYCLDKTKTTGRSKKLEPIIWQGPFIIVRKFSDLLFEIKTDQKKPKIVHHDRLKKYYSDIIPDWAHALKMKLAQEKEMASQQLQNRNKNNNCSIKLPAKAKPNVTTLRRGLRNRRQTDFFKVK